MSRKLLLDKLVERLLQLFAANGEIRLFAMTERGDATGFLNDDQVLINVDQPHIVGRRRRRSGVVKNLDDIAGLHLPLAVEAQIAVDLNPTAADQPADLA